MKAKNRLRKKVEEDAEDSREKATIFFEAEKEPRSRKYKVYILLGVFSGTVLLAIGLLLRLYPELSMALNSQCKVKARGWDGKVMGVRIGATWNGWVDYNTRPRSHNLHHRTNATGDRRLRGIEEEIHSSHVPVSGRALSNENHQVIIWGSHHRTGTILASKIFAKLCSKMHWCCVFHPTRDSVEAIRSTLENEDVHLFGHNQWIWNPKELFGDLVPYRFVHFYRNPVSKILSGYKYHKAGTETWTKKVLPYQNLCNTTDISARSVSEISRAQVVRYCESTQLCQTCCRREHEQPQDLVPSQQWAPMQLHTYAPRKHKEYKYMCSHLGHVSTSLQEALRTLPEEEGLAVEAAIEFFENNRMVAILEQTQRDTSTLNIDTDSFVNDFTPTVRKIIKHVSLGLSDNEEEEIVKDLEFYDLDRSFFYRWTQNNVFNSHIQADVNPTEDQMNKIVSLRDTLMSQMDFINVYGPLLARFKKAIE